MTTLKTLRTRKASVQSTQKITIAMKMVAAAKLRRAEEDLLKRRPYAERMAQMLSTLAQQTTALETPQPLLTGRKGDPKTQLLIVATSERGLCGAFNGNIIKFTRQLINDLKKKGCGFKILCLGRRGKTVLEKEYKNLIVDLPVDLEISRPSFSVAKMLAHKLISFFEEEAFDTCGIIYNYFHSALRQEVKMQTLIPLPKDALSLPQFVYDYEPSEASLLTDLLNKNLAVQIYQALSENLASEEGARMTAMGNASHNAEDMVRTLTLTYNRTRQAHITRELIEIISGAEAL